MNQTMRENLHRLKQQDAGLHSRAEDFLQQHPSFTPCWASTKQTAPKIDADIIGWFGLEEHFFKFLPTQNSPKTHVVIEPSLEKFCSFLAHPEFQTSPNIFWIIGTPLEAFPDQLGKILRSDLILQLEYQKAKFVHVTGYEEDYFQHVRQVWASLTTVAAADTHINPFDEFFGFSNSIKNTQTLLKAPFMHHFKDRFKNLPGIVVSTGPSLNKTLPFLRGLEKKAIIYCADSSYKMLLKHGITPHFVGSFERTKLAEHFFEGASTEGTTLIATSVIGPATASRFAGRLIHFLRPQFGLKHFFPDVPVSDLPMHSVAHLGVYSLQEMGCSSIYLVGQDLCFDPDSKAGHADNYLLKKEEQPWTPIQAENHLGQNVETDIVWQQFAYSLSELIQHGQVPCYNVIPKRYGIKINHAVQVEPSDQAFHFPPHGRAIDEENRQLFQNFTENFQEESVEDFLTQKDRTIAHLKENLPIATETLGDILSFVQASHTEEDYRLFRKNLEQRLARLKDPLWKSFLSFLIYGKNMELAKKMRHYPLTGVDQTSQWNYLSFLSSWVSQYILMSQLALNELR